MIYVIVIVAVSLPFLLWAKLDDYGPTVPLVLWPFALAIAMSLTYAIRDSIAHEERMDRIEAACHGRVVCTNLAPWTWFLESDGARTTEGHVCGCAP